MLLFTCCSGSSPDDFRHEGESVSRELILELKLIRSRDDLLVHAPRLQELFNRLVDIIIAAKTFQDEHSFLVTEMLPLESQGDTTVSDRLRVELNRVLHMEGGREVIERSQETALNRLELFKKSGE